MGILSSPLWSCKADLQIFAIFPSQLSGILNVISCQLMQQMNKSEIDISTLGITHKVECLKLKEIFDSGERGGQDPLSMSDRH